MKTLRNIIILTLVMGLTVFAKTKVRVDYNQNVSFEHLKTYSWTDQFNDNEVDRALSGSLVNNRIHEAIDRELADIGYQKTSQGEADFLIAYHVSTEEKTKVSSSGGYYGSGHYGGSYYGRGYHSYPRFSYGYHGQSRYYRRGYGHSYGHSYGGYNSAPIVHEYLEVTLTLNIIDAQTGAVIWSGWAIKSLDQHPRPKKVRKLITKSVHKILKELPSEYVQS